MKKLGVLVFTFLLPLVSYATDIRTVESVIDAAILDLNDDAGFDRAVLVAEEEGSDADLYIFLSSFDEATREHKTDLAAVKKGFVFNGPMWGQQPSLSVNSKGSLQITSMNEAIGRGRFTQVLTVVYRNNQLLVGGVTYTYRDTLDPEVGGTCDVNFLTGKGIHNGKRIQVPAGGISLDDWSEEQLAKVCQLN
ncbi:MAG: hypothetical protein AB7G93_17055 [Bdellovibrionales bacterium]